ncbi:MAG: twin-arginine translocation signal domain-containing protein [Tannerella sp.]|nr:twin-arginine translocation signal domain-containing protein [Tannerella sp.]
MKHSLESEALSRRDFIRRTSLGAAAMALTPASSLLAHPAKPFWPKNAKKYRIYMIGHAHLDVVWLWPWQEGLAVAHSTFRSALERMKETPDLVFTSSSALYYKWVAANDPDMLAEIRRRVAEGRWNIVGGWWIEPDTNIPSGESMVRQGLYGQRTFQELLGRRAEVAFTADSFGHAGTLPQIFKLQGMDSYVFMRPGGGEKDLPANLFWWEAPDGSRILAYRIHHHYGSLDQGEARTTREDIRGAAEYIPQHPVPMIMKFFGVGDHGGGPSKAHIGVINEARAEKEAPVIFYSSIDRYFSDVRQQHDLSQLPVVRDDLQHHAPGCYTADSAIKRNNRLAEAALVTAEKIAAAGSVAWKVRYPGEALAEAWEKILFLQFHDSMAGTSLVSQYQYARHGYGHALDVAEDITFLTLQKLEWQVAAEDPEARYMVVFNPHAWEYRGVIRYESDRGSICYTDDKGREFPSQWITGQAQTHGRHTLLLQVVVPPAGYCQIKGVACESPLAVNSPARAEERRLENEYYVLSFSDRGTVGIFDKETGKQVFAGGETGCRAVVIDDPSDTWSHDVKTFANEIGAFGNASVKRLYNGPLQATVRVTTVFGKSALTVDWSLTAGSRRIDAEVTLDWHERLKMLKFSFPVDVSDPVPTYESPYGFIVRQPNGDEDPGHRWMDVTGRRDGATCGLAVINDAKYGYSATGNDMRISVVRSPVYAHHQPKELLPDAEYEWMDQGMQTFRMALVPHKDSWKEINLPRMAEEFMTPPIPIYQGIHPGTMPKSGSFLEVADAPNVTVAAIKQSEEGNDTILRLVETLGRDTPVTLRFPSAGFSWSGKMRGCEIKTLRLNTDTGSVREVNLLEE